MNFPDQLTQADLEILLKEWTLAGGYAHQTTYWVGFIETELSTHWTAFYIGKSFDSDDWVKAETKDPEGAGLDAMKVAWIWWMNRNVKDPAWHALLDYVDGELDYKLEELIDDPRDNDFDARGILSHAVENLLEHIQEEVLDELEQGLEEYGK